MNKQAMTLALEALEWINRVNAMEYEYQQKARESLNAIYEALAEQPAQQEPVAWWNQSKDSVSTDPVHRHNSDCQPLYITPPPCPTCEALARTVMMDQTGRDA